jgi:hypothetical protein
LKTLESKLSSVKDENDRLKTDLAALKATLEHTRVENNYLRTGIEELFHISQGQEFSNRRLVSANDVLHVGSPDASD